MAFMDDAQHDAERWVELHLSQPEGIDKPELLRGLVELLMPPRAKARRTPPTDTLREPTPRENRLTSAALHRVAQRSADAEQLVEAHNQLAAQPDGAEKINLELRAALADATPALAEFLATYQVFAEVEVPELA